MRSSRSQPFSVSQTRNSASWATLRVGSVFSCSPPSSTLTFTAPDTSSRCSTNCCRTSLAGARHLRPAGDPPGELAFLANLRQPVECAAQVAHARVVVGQAEIAGSLRILSALILMAAATPRTLVLEPSSGPHRRKQRLVFLEFQLAVGAVLLVEPLQREGEQRQGVRVGGILDHAFGEPRLEVEAEATAPALR